MHTISFEHWLWHAILTDPKTLWTFESDWPKSKQELTNYAIIHNFLSTSDVITSIFEKNKKLKYHERKTLEILQSKQNNANLGNVVRQFLNVANNQPVINIHPKVEWINASRIIENIDTQNTCIIFFPCLILNSTNLNLIIQQSLFQNFINGTTNSALFFLYLKYGPISIIQHPHSNPITYSDSQNDQSPILALHLKNSNETGHILLSFSDPNSFFTYQPIIHKLVNSILLYIKTPTPQKYLTRKKERQQLQKKNEDLSWIEVTQQMKNALNIIKSGHSLAIYGLGGSGKSTLIKYLCSKNSKIQVLSKYGHVSSAN